VLEDQIPGEFQSARGRDRAPERPVELAVVLVEADDARGRSGTAPLEAHPCIIPRTVTSSDSPPPLHREASKPRRGAEDAMTTRNSTLDFGTIGKGRGWKDAFVVTVLAVVLGAFVAHLWSPPAGASASQPYAAAVRVAATQG
jgi:hypothetical protein